MNGFTDGQWTDDDSFDEALEARARRQYECRLARFPDCRDPDHPGCDMCNEDEGDEDEES